MLAGGTAGICRSEAPVLRCYSTGMHPILMKPVGRVHNTIHRGKEDYWGDVQSTVRLDSENFTPDALLGLEEFSPVEIFFACTRWMIQQSWSARGTRGQPGVAANGRVSTARKSATEPATTCPLLSVNGLELTVSGLDAVDGTPVLDIKPIYAEFLRSKDDIRQPRWSRELMARYLSVPGTRDD